jgi:hypothetical protein
MWNLPPAVNARQVERGCAARTAMAGLLLGSWVTVMQQSEFDRFTDEDTTIHSSNIRISGETPEFFAEYKLRVMRERCDQIGFSPRRILDLGGGIGSSAPHLR